MTVPSKVTPCDPSDRSDNSESWDAKLSDPEPLTTPAVVVLRVNPMLPVCCEASAPGVVAVIPVGIGPAAVTRLSVSAPVLLLVKERLPVAFPVF